MTDAERPLLPSKAQLHVRWGQLYGSATSLWLAEAARKASGPLLVIAADARQASRIEDELRFFCEPGRLHRDLPGMGDAALRPVLAASRHRVAATAHAVGAAAPRQGHRHRRSRNAAAATAAAGVHRRARLRPERRRTARRRSVSRSAERRRLRRELAGDGARRIRGARLAHRSVPNGQPTRPIASTCSTTRSRPSACSTGDAALGREASQALRLLPAREFPLTADGIQQFKRRFRNRFPGDLTRMAIYRDIAEGAPPPGIEYYLPLFFDATATLFDYLPANTIVAAETDVRGCAGAGLRAKSQSRYEQRGHDAERPILDARRSVHARRRARAAPGGVAPDRAVARRARSADAVAALSELRTRARRRACASIRAARSRRASSRASCANSRAAC